jgi:hypothetical protein
MVYKGTVKDGVVVLEGGPPLPEGTEVRVEPVEAAQPQAQAKPIWEVAAEIGRSIPDSELEKLPTDLSKRFHHYLYGSDVEEKE